MRESKWNVRELIVKLWRMPQVYALLFWLLVLGVVAVSFDSLLMPWVAGKWTDTQTVPTLVGKPSAQAEQLLLDAGLRCVWSAEGQYSSKVPQGHVMIQVPAPGRTVKEGRSVMLTVSKGRRELTIPDLYGKSQRQAEISLGRLGLALGSNSEAPHATLPKGVVVRTEPGAGRMVRTGETVSLVLSAGRSGGNAELPSLVDKSVDQAFHVLDSMEMQVGEVIRKNGSGKLPNTVLEQRPRSGEMLSPGSKVDLIVAD